MNRVMPLGHCVWHDVVVAYTDDERQAALDAYLAEGASAASRTTGVPARTIRYWARNAGLTTARRENLQQAAIDGLARWEERRVALANEMGEVADKAVLVAATMLEADDTKRAKEAALTAAILTDKAQLLTGAATARIEHNDLDTIDAEVARLAAELGLAPEPVTEPA